MTHTATNLRTGQSMAVQTTSYGDLKDGDEFVRWLREIDLTDAEGVADFAKWVEEASRAPSA